MNLLKNFLAFTNESPTSEVTPSLLNQRHSSTSNTTFSTTKYSIYNSSPTDLSSEYFSRFLDPSVEITYADFVVKSTEYSVFKLQDYGWDHCVSMVNTLFSGVGDVLDAEFSKIWDITDYRYSILFFFVDSSFSEIIWELFLMFYA